MFRGPIIIFLLYLLCDNGVKSFIFLEMFDSLKSAVALGKSITDSRSEQDIARIFYEDRSVEDMLENVGKQLKQISTKLDRMESRLSNQMESMEHNLIKKLGLSHKLNNQLSKLYDHITAVDEYYENFLRYSNRNVNYNNNTIIDFIRAATTHGRDSLVSTIKKIHSLVIPGGRAVRIQKSVLTLLQKELYESYKELCGDNLSPQRRLYDLFETIMITEMKAYATTVYAYKMKSSFENQTYINEQKDLTKDLDSRVMKYLIVITSAMRNAPRDIRTCDPPRHKPRETHIELEGLYSPYFINEYEMHNHLTTAVRGIRGECDIGCKHSLIFENKRYCWSKMCNEKKCLGKLVNCDTGPTSLDACMSKIPSKRYDWYTDNDDSITYGDNSIECSDRMKNMYRWYQWVPYFYCEVCRCTCENYGPTTNVINTISLMEQLSNIKRNMVIVGVRFKLRGELIALEIKQGKLGADGLITDDSWLESPNYLYNNNLKHYQKDNGTHDILAEDNEIHETLDAKTHYAHFDKSQITKVNLDELVLPQGYVLTGVKLERSGSNLFAKIRGTKFDYPTGVLSPNINIWLDPSKIENDIFYNRSRKNFVISSPKNPEKSPVNKLDSVPNLSVEITMTNMEDDAGSHIVPFFDAQDLAVEPGFPLAGLSLAHRGSTGYGGFIIWQLINYDIAEYLDRSYYWKPGNIKEDADKLSNNNNPRKKTDLSVHFIHSITDCLFVENCCKIHSTFISN